MIGWGAKGASRTVASHRPWIKMGWAGAALLLVALAGSSQPAAAQQPPPDEEWRTLRTGPFRVTFPAHLEDLGRRAAFRAEVALEALAESLLEPPDGTIDILLTDHTDFSNGFAQVTPSNRITIYARPPVDEPGLGYFDDWLELVLTHEIAHVVHLDHTGTVLGRGLRGLFGRVPAEWPFFPGLGTPRWLTEGLATWYESALTRSGRIHGTFHEMQIRTAVLEDRFEGIGSASGPSPVWPAGNRPYAYGSLFFEHLLERYGEKRMGDFAEAVAGQWIPYRMDAAGREAFGISLSDAWEDWGDSLRTRYAKLDRELERLGPVTEPEPLTRHARWAVEPTVAPDGTLAYVRSDGRSDSRLVLRSAAGEEVGSFRVNGIASFDWMPDGRLLVSQLEYEGPYHLFSDLWIYDREGSGRRLTEGARVAQPSVAPSGDWAVAVQEGEGTTELVRVDLGSGAVTSLTEPASGEHWAYPELSPGGDLVAATRWRTGGLHDVVILDSGSGKVLAEVTRDRALDLAPSWSPDGRWVVWASDRTGILNVLAAPVDPRTGEAGAPRLVTNVRTGVAFPSVGPGADRLYLSAYHADGWDLAHLAFAPEDAPPAPEPAGRFAVETAFADGRSTAPVEDYSPWSTLWPRYWQPMFREPVRAPAVVRSDLFLRERELLGFAVGARTGGRDLVGRHAYDAFARVFTSGGKAEGGVAYAWAGLGNPVLSLGATQFWDDDGTRLGQVAEGAPLDTLFVLERERSAYGAVTFRSRAWRRSAELSLRGGYVQEHRELWDNDLRPSATYRFARPTAELADVRASVAVSTARSYAFQVGASRGLELYLSGRLRREISLPDTLQGVEGSDRALDDVVGRVRGYLPLGGPGHAPHVLALQIAGGIAGGPAAPGGHFEVGGATGWAETITGLRLFGGAPVFFPTRGYPTSSRLGRYAWSASGEYRFPIRLVHQGLGAWPLYVGRIVGALFADAGDAWDPEASDGFLAPARKPLASVGAEIALELVALYDLSLLTRVGMAQPLVEGSGPTLYVRLGLPF